MSKKEEVIAYYQKSYNALTTQLNHIEAHRKIYPLWTIREIVAHLAGWDDATIGFLSALLKGELPPTPAMRGEDIYNEETVSTREGLSYDQILREYYSTRQKLIDLIKQANDQILTTPATLPWGGQGTVEQVAKFLSSHETEHAQDIQKIIEEARAK